MILLQNRVIRLKNRTDMLCQPQRQSMGVRKRRSVQNTCTTFHKQSDLASIQLASTSGTSVRITTWRMLPTWDDGGVRAVADDTPHHMACDLAITSR